MDKEPEKPKKLKKTKADTVEKILEDYTDVFADIVNVIIYGGRKVVKPENLVAGPTQSLYKEAEGNYSEKIRDVAKYDVRRNVRFALYGLENQTGVSYVMPVRIMGYDYATLEKQVRDIKESNKLKGKEPKKYSDEINPGQKLYPPITIVLYFGLKHWDGPKSLYEMFRIPEGTEQYVNDYKINLVEVAFLDDQVIEKFQSDFKVIAKIFKAKRLGNLSDLRYNPDVWVHVAAIMEFLRTFTGDTYYSEIKQTMIDQSMEGGVSVCNLLDLSKDEGRTEGLLEGRTEGKAEGIYTSLENLMHNYKLNVNVAMDALGFSEEDRNGYPAWKAAKNK